VGDGKHCINFLGGYDVRFVCERTRNKKIDSSVKQHITTQNNQLGKNVRRN